MKDEVMNIVDTCKDLEKGMGESERSLNCHISNINKNMTYMQTISKLISKDRYILLLLLG